MNQFNEKQIEILLVAEKLFAEEGFDGTSIRDIAKIANINIAMISYYFGSKDKLLESLILYRISGMSLRLESLYQENIPPIEKIEKLIVYYIENISTNRLIYQILHIELSNKKREINLDAFKEVKNNNLKLLQNIIKEGQDLGLFQPDINVPLIPPVIIGSFIHFLKNKMYYQELLELKNDTDFETYIKTDLTPHIQKTVKALLTHH
ncbi:MAG: TetR/AcrR family transcriptional regulator [Flavobacterium sp.]